LNRNYDWQLRRAMNCQADLYIAHNAGAIAVAAEAAKATSVQFAFDAEDFHRAEGLSAVQRKAVEDIEGYYLPNASVLYAASPLIAKEYEKLFNRPVASVLNVFPKPARGEAALFTAGEPLKLFWFSQKIGKGRGVEEIIKAIGKAKAIPTELHLLGLHDNSTVTYFKHLIAEEGLDEEQVTFYAPVSPDEIFSLARNFHIGMATETGEPYNRDICLTNKIFTYIQAGLPVIASDTAAQHDLLQRFPGVGKLYRKKDVDSLGRAIQSLGESPESLENFRKACRIAGENELNWALEGRKLLSLIPLVDSVKRK
jgi:glycosyltransferase involved in cell wall biosynthesis